MSEEASHLSEEHVIVTVSDEPILEPTSEDTCILDGACIPRSLCGPAMMTHQAAATELYNRTLLSDGRHDGQHKDSFLVAAGLASENFLYSNDCRTDKQSEQCRFPQDTQGSSALMSAYPYEDSTFFAPHIEPPEQSPHGGSRVVI